jgi:hypothetical protein
MPAARQPASPPARRPPATSASEPRRTASIHSVHIPAGSGG